MTVPDPTLPLPRILCLHGGGVNADIFAAQARALIARLAPYFRLVFVDGPFLCAAHEDIVAEGVAVPPGVADASMRSTQFEGLPEGITGDAHVLKLPTVHVHGLRDPGLEMHRVMMKSYCEEGTTRLVEWNGGHRVPIKQADVDAVVGEILSLGRELGLVDGGELA
ncbi:Sorting nexin mvp-1 [Verticillium dahliae VDG2]|nr:Sorting nexin mvp-1 [Verticillium dahliae VDG2]